MRLYLYATDNVDPAHATNVTEWGIDPIDGEYDPRFEFDGRGADIVTLGGRVIQDWGLNEKDRKIRIAGKDLNPTEKSALQTKYETTNGQFYFTARVAAATPAEVWKVQFRRSPAGFVAVLDAPMFAVGGRYSEPPPSGYERYHYEMVLLVVEKMA